MRAVPPSPARVARSPTSSRDLARGIAAANDAVAVLKVATPFVNAGTNLLNAAPAPAGAPPRTGLAADLQVERKVRATNMEFLDLGRR